MTLQPPTVDTRLLIYRSLLNKQAPPLQKKQVIKIKSLPCLARELPCQRPPNIGGIGQFPKPFLLIKIGIPVKDYNKSMSGDNDIIQLIIPQWEPLIDPVPSKLAFLDLSRVIHFTPQL